MGSLYRICVVAISMLISYIATEPYQCPDLRKVIPCLCQARMFKGVEIPSQIVINCRNFNFSTVPPITGSSTHIIYEMTLTQNNIQTIPAAAFDGLQIQRLDLRQNRLTNISTESFQGLENVLKELYVGAQKGAGIQFPIASVTNITTLNSLYMEYFTFPRNFVSRGNFNRLAALTSLTLAYNQVTGIQDLALPQSLTSLTLDHQNLASLPIDALRSLPNLQSLTVTNTLVSAVYMQAFNSNTKLVHLDLGHNTIRNLGAGSFDGITNSLQTLSLKNNPIESVTSISEIKELKELTSLKLSETRLTNLAAGADFLKNKTSLTVLYLDGNNFSTLGPNVFATIGNLQELYLGKNQLHGMDDQVFADLSSLKYLDLGQQTIPSGSTFTLPPSLVSLPSLQTLKLTRTKLNQATLWPKISRMTSLEILHLDGTSLTSVNDYSFRNLTQLKELDLGNNLLPEVTQEMLAGPLGLSKLILNNNRITTVNRCAFYGFTLPPPLSVELTGNPLHCDCKLKWLLEEREKGNITLTNAEKCETPADKAGRYLVFLPPADLTCAAAPPDTPCLELYTTPQPPVTSTMPTPILGVTVTNVSTTSIIISWTVTNFPGLSHFQVRHINLETAQSFLSGDILAASRSRAVTGLQENTEYSVCVIAYGSPTASTQTTEACVQRKTQASGTPGKRDGDATSEIGIIVGTIVAVLVLLAIVAAIIYLVFLRKRDRKELPAQPHVFTAGELPGMTANSRQFTRPKEKQPPKVGRALDEIKVTVISDGQTAPVSPGGRQSVGSYQFLDEQHPNPYPEAVPKDHSTYNNDTDSRPLPTAPDDSLKGYYNGGLQSSNFYNEIE